MVSFGDSAIVSLDSTGLEDLWKLCPQTDGKTVGSVIESYLTQTFLRVCRIVKAGASESNARGPIETLAWTLRDNMINEKVCINIPRLLAYTERASIGTP